jgi:hypothetical protein
MRNIDLYRGGRRGLLGGQVARLPAYTAKPYDIETLASARYGFGADMFRALTAKAEKDKEDKIRSGMLAAMIGPGYEYDPSKASESFERSPYVETQRAALRDAQAQPEDALFEGAFVDNIDRGVDELGLGSDPEVGALFGADPENNAAMQAALIGDIKTPLGYAGDRGGLPASTEAEELAAYAGSAEEMAAQKRAHRATVNTPDAVAARMAEAVRLNPEIVKDPAYAQFVQSHVAEQQRLRAESTARDRAVGVRDEERLYNEKISDIENRRKIAAALVKQQGEETIEGLKPRSSGSGLTKPNAPYKRLRKDGTPGLFQMQQQSDGTWLEKDLGNPLEDGMSWDNMTAPQKNAVYQARLEKQLREMIKENPDDLNIPLREKELETYIQNVNRDPDTRQQLKFQEQVGTDLGTTAVTDYIAAQGVVGKVAKIDELIRRLNSTEASDLGFLADLKQLGRRGLAVFGDKEALSKVSDVEMIEQLMDSDVFLLIDALGIGARGLDTPAERDFLRRVMTGRITLTKETLLAMAYQRRGIQRDISLNWNRKMDEGGGDKFTRVDIPRAIGAVERYDIDGNRIQ